MIRYNNFHRLDPQVRDVALELLESANQQQSEIASFLLVWMAFNGWMAAVTACHHDAAMIRALAAEPRANREFESLMARNSGFNREVADFAEMWPVLNVRDVRAKLGFDAFRRYDRAGLLVACASNAVKQEPRDWRPNARPLWGNLLRTIYQVRCNLFHGEKSPQNARDYSLIRQCWYVLHGFITETHCFDWFDQ